jgi:hypothetical protein
MSRKLWFGMAATLIVALVAGLSVSGVAFASGGVTHTVSRSAPSASSNGGMYSPARSVAGQLIQVGAGMFTIHTNQDQDLTFRYDFDTRFQDAQKAALKASNLAVGDWVTVYADHLSQLDFGGPVGRILGHSSRMALQSPGRFGMDSRFLRGDQDENVAKLVIISTQKPAVAAPQSKPAATAAPATVTTPAAPAAPTATPAAPASTPAAKPTTAPASGGTYKP